MTIGRGAGALVIMAGAAGALLPRALGRFAAFRLAGLRRAAGLRPATFFFFAAFFFPARLFAMAISSRLRPRSPVQCLAA
jgi:hypothetical protein